MKERHEIVDQDRQVHIIAVREGEDGRLLSLSPGSHSRDCIAERTEEAIEKAGGLAKEMLQEARRK